MLDKTPPRDISQAFASAYGGRMPTVAERWASLGTTEKKIMLCMTWSEHRRHVRTESGLGSDALNDTLETLNRKTHTFNRTQRMSFLRAAPLTESDLKKMCPYVVSPVGALGATEKLVADSLAGGWDAHDIGKAPFGNSKAPLGYYQAVKIIEKILHDLGVEEEHQAGAMALVYDIRTRRFPESLPKLEIPAL